jgi:excisionase family DNA binding protein
MQLIYLTEEDLRRIIREENNASKSTETAKSENPQKLHSQKETCRFIGITEPTIIRWRKKGKIPFKQLGASIRYNLNDVIEALEAKNKGVKR